MNLNSKNSLKLDNQHRNFLQKSLASASAIAGLHIPTDAHA